MRPKSGNALTDKLRAYFQAHPGELITLQDLVRQFSYARTSIQNAIAALREEGIEIESKQGFVLGPLVAEHTQDRQAP